MKNFYLKLLFAIALVISVPYFLAFMKQPFWFIVSLPLVILGLLTIAGLLISELIYRFLHPGLRRIHDQQKLRYRGVVVLGILIMVAGGFIAFRFFPPGMRPIVVLSFLIYVIIFEWRVLLIKSKGWLWPVTAVLIIFLNVLAYLSPSPSGSSLQFSREQLKSVPYFTWTPAAKDPEKSGVTLNKKEEASPGLNLYNSRNASEAHLIDMDGNVIHTWSADTGKFSSWAHVEAAENGGLFAIVEDRKLMKLKFDSTIEWTHNARHHHDLAVAENKNIYAIIRKDDIEFYHGIPLPLLNDYIAVLDPNGKLISETSIYSLMKTHVRFSSVKNIYRWIFNPRLFVFTVKSQLAKRKMPFIFWEDTPLDVFHTNAIELTNRSIAGFCNKEDWLLSVRQLDTVCVVNPATMKVTWEWGRQELSKQHNPTLLQNGNILIFDNGFSRKYSRVVEIDPINKNIVWQYKTNPPERFFSRSRGGAERLPNGNTLITETDSGHVFEVTPKGDIVWEFYNPEKQRNQRAVIYRMNRLSLTPDVVKMYSQSLSGKN